MENLRILPRRPRPGNSPQGGTLQNTARWSYLPQLPRSSRDTARVEFQGALLITIDEQRFGRSGKMPPMRTTRAYAIDDFLFAAADEDDAFRIASEMLATGSYSNSNHDGDGDLTHIFAVGIHQLEEVARVSEVAEMTQGRNRIDLPGFYLGDVDSDGVPIVRQKEELEVFRFRRLQGGVTPQDA